MQPSYAQDLADKLARDCRGIMMSPWYRQLFPTRLALHRQAVQEFILLAVASFAVLTGVQRPSRWAALSAAPPLRKREGFASAITSS